MKRSELAGWAGYGYCASHSRFFWGLRLHLICTPAGLPVTWALANPKLDERNVLMAVLEHDPTLTADRPGLVIIADTPLDLGGGPREREPTAQRVVCITYRTRILPAHRRVQPVRRAHRPGTPRHP